MQAFFSFLAANPYMLLFLTVGLAVWIGRQSIAGYGLGMVAAAIIVGCGLSVWASMYGMKLELNNFTRLLFYYLFMYGVGLRVGPSFVNSLGGDGLKFSILAVVSCVIGLGLVVVGAKLFDLPMGAAGGMLAGSQTMSAAIGSAEQAVLAGAVKPPAGTTPEAVTAMIALSYGITYIWGTVGIILITQIPAAMVGRRRTRGGPRTMRRSMACPAATRRPSPAGPPAACAPTGWTTPRGWARPCAISSGSIPNTGRSTSFARARRWVRITTTRSSGSAT